MSIWTVQDAKARFSEFLDTCIAQGAQMVTKRGEEAAVLLPVAEWRRLQAAARPSIKQLLLPATAPGDLAIPARAELTMPARAELTMPARGQARRRAAPDLA
jgi:prevent-host-death family protein